MKSDGDVLKHTTCFREQRKRRKPCDVRTCRYWVEAEHIQNCSIIGSGDGPHTLQEVGDIFGITRMRVCEIEKANIKKLNYDLGDDL